MLSPGERATSREQAFSSSSTAATRWRPSHSVRQLLADVDDPAGYGDCRTRPQSARHRGPKGFAPPLLPVGTVTRTANWDPHRDMVTAKANYVGKPRKRRGPMALR
jgi:hypothetical protein